MKRALAVLFLAFNLMCLPASAQITKAVPFDTAVTVNNVPSVTVAGLPACNAAAFGLVYFVTNALLPTVLGIVTGGGSVQTLVHCNGANWIAG